MVDGTLGLEAVGETRCCDLAVAQNEVGGLQRSHQFSFEFFFILLFFHLQQINQRKINILMAIVTWGINFCLWW